jgi:poly(A) polymerase
VRGARYAARLSLELEQQSLNQVRRTLEAWPWRWNVGDPPGQAPPALGTRLRRELELLLHQEVWPKGLAVLQAWRGLQVLDQALQNDYTWLLRLRRAHRLQIPLMVALLTPSPDPLTLAERLQLPHRQHRLIAEWLALRDHLPDESSRLDVTDWCELLERPGSSRDAVALALLAGKSNRRPL